MKEKFLIVSDVVFNVQTNVLSQKSSLARSDLSSHSHYLRNPVLARHKVRDSQREHSLSRHYAFPFIPHTD